MTRWIRAISSQTTRPAAGDEQFQIGLRFANQLPLGVTRIDRGPRCHLGGTHEDQGRAGMVTEKCSCYGERPLGEREASSGTNILSAFMAPSPYRSDQWTASRRSIPMYPGIETPTIRKLNANA